MADSKTHVFDQTNGAIKAEAGADEHLSAEEKRRREQSSALAYGMFGTGHN